MFRLVPRPFTTAMMAMEMPAAIRPYSMAVAADWSFTSAKQVHAWGCCSLHMIMSPKYDNPLQIDGM